MEKKEIDYTYIDNNIIVPGSKKQTVGLHKIFIFCFFVPFSFRDGQYIGFMFEVNTHIF